LLIGELAFGAESARGDPVTGRILTGTLLAALLAAVFLRFRDRIYRRIAEANARDNDANGVPDVPLQDFRDALGLVVPDREAL